MIDHPEFDNPNLRILARKLKTIDKVLQVRYNPLISKDLIEKFGPNTFRFSVVTEKNPNDPQNREFKIFNRYIGENMWNDSSSNFESNISIIFNDFVKDIEYYNNNPTIPQGYGSTET